MQQHPLSSVAQEIRRMSVQMTTTAQSGHLTSSLSCAEILAVLFGRILHYDHTDPENLANDRFILSKGHATPALYAMYGLMGWIPSALLSTYRQYGSPLEGHPTRALPWIDVCTGSLGQGLAVGMGMAVGMKDIDSPAQVYVLMGDGEMAEGSVWEALAVAHELNIKNMTVIVDLNAYGQSGLSQYDHNAHKLAERVKPFGWDVNVVDGHNLYALEVVLAQHHPKQPQFIIAKTIKGKGIEKAENKPGWHAKVLKPEEEQEALRSLPAMELPLRISPVPPEDILRASASHYQSLTSFDPPEFSGDVATKYAFGTALKYLAHDPEFIALDADVKNSTTLDQLLEHTPDKLLEVGIAEQTMIGMATGLDVMGKKPVVSTFAAFLTRAHDQIRMAGLSQRNMLINGSYSGVSIGKDGSSQMGIDDIAMMRGIQSATVLYPSDAYSAYALTRLGYGREGITYIRTTREPVPVLYTPDTPFEIGGCHVLGAHPYDDITIVAAGITVIEAFIARRLLAQEEIDVRVVDLYSIQPLDKETLLACLNETGGKMIVVEDHRVAGGIGEAVLSAIAGFPGLSFQHLAIRQLPHTASPDEQLQLHGIDADTIASVAKTMLGD